MNKTKLKIKLTVLTGLHIGVGNDKIQIGGVDGALIKDPISHLPYLPGSSIKGKIRCLLETEHSKCIEESFIEEINNAFGFTDQFKRTKENKWIENNQKPTRFVFRDLSLNEEFTKAFQSNSINLEIKTEVAIDRKKGTASTAGPRSFERIPPTVVFEGEILIRYADQTELDNLKILLKDGIELLNNDYLGGSGSRGYGSVKVEIL